MATILLGVSGSIAAYKAADLASKLTQRGHDVSCVLTRSACQLVQPSTFLNLTGNHVFTDLWDPHGQTQHIALTDRADLCVVAPATANLLAKVTLGLADDMLSTTLLAVACPVLLCPAMNTRMWQNPVVQQNMARARALGHQIVEPGSGALACGHVGPGRMAEPLEIVEAIERALAGERAMGESAVGESAAPSSLFLEVLRCEAPAPAELVERERTYRADAHRRGALVASGPLGADGFAHVHRAASLDAARELAAKSPLVAAGARVEISPWALEGASLWRLGSAPRAPG